MNEATTLVGQDMIQGGQFLARRAALSIWIKTGIPVSRNLSILAVCKKAYNLHGNKYRVMEQMNEMRDRLLLENISIREQLES